MRGVSFDLSTESMLVGIAEATKGRRRVDRSVVDCIAG